MSRKAKHRRLQKPRRRHSYIEIVGVELFAEELFEQIDYCSYKREDQLKGYQ